MTHFIRINKFNNRYDNLVKSLGDHDWDDICLHFSEHQPVINKDHAALFNMVRYQDNVANPPDDQPLPDHLGFLPDTGEVVPLRRKINQVQVDALVLDYDGGITLDEVKQRFVDYTYLGYTSYSHLKDGTTHKFRLIFPLSKPIPICRGDETVAIYSDLEVPLGNFAGPCDPVIINPNQVYYIPATHPDRLELATSWVNQGKILDWTTWDITKSVETRTDFSAPNRPLVAKGHNNRLDPETEFVTKEGIVKAKDVRKTYQKVSCPFHGDKSGSEFLKRFDDSGVIYFHCKHCGGFSFHPDPIEPATPTQSDFGSVQDAFEFPEEVLLPESIDRTAIQQELKKIAQKIVNDQVQNPKTLQWDDFKAHILYLPEGSGKSQLAIDLVRQGWNIVFACQTWDQVYSKQQEFQHRLKSDDPDKHINVRIANSFESHFRRKWNLKTLREESGTGYSINKIDKDATINALIASHPTVSRSYIEVWWNLFNQNDEKIKHTMLKAQECQVLMTVRDDPDFGITLEEKTLASTKPGMVLTTFSQLRLLSTRGDFLPRNWIIWIDDPGLDDVANISPLVDSIENGNDPIDSANQERSSQLGEILARYGEKYTPSTEDNLVKALQNQDDDDSDQPRLANPVKTRTKVIDGQTYYLRATQQSLGYSTQKHRMVFTTTEQLTKIALTRHLTQMRRMPVIHEMMEKIPYGDITILGTDKVRRSQDAVIPLILRRLEKKNLSIQLIADGLGSNFNHVNSKGVNVLTDTDLLVEVSIPHPAEVKKVCALLGLDYTSEQQEVTLNLMLDKIHQAIGRNSGFRWKGKECVVLVDKRYHKNILQRIRYRVDAENSVVIDKTQKMSIKDSRITPTASAFTRLMEEQLTKLDGIFNDRRSITHAIDHVIKSIASEEKRTYYIARLLTALSTLSKTALDKPKVDSTTESHRVSNFRYAWNHIQSTWVTDANRAKVMKDYHANQKDRD